jgi:hypothetical protein
LTANIIIFVLHKCRYLELAAGIKKLAKKQKAVGKVK